MQSRPSDSLYVWDPLVRVFHWSLAVFFFTSWLTGEEESDIHIWSGYAIIGLIGFRLLWGFVGTRHARFSDFVHSPRQVFGYLKSLTTGKPEHYTGHNPAGGYMVVLLLAMLALTTWSGLNLYGAEGHGPLAGDATSLSLVNAAHADDDEYGEREEEENEGEHSEDEAAEEFWEEIHETAANLTLALVFIHVFGVIVSSRLHRENLVKAMFTGRKPVPRR